MLIKHEMVMVYFMASGFKFESNVNIHDRVLHIEIGNIWIINTMYAVATASRVLEHYIVLIDHVHQDGKWAKNVEL